MADPIDLNATAEGAENTSKKINGLTEHLVAYMKNAKDSAEETAALGGAFDAAGSGVKRFITGIGGGLTEALKSVKEVGEVALASISKNVRGLYDPLKESTVVANAFGNKGGEAIRGFDEAVKSLITSQMTMRQSIVVSGQSIKDSAEAIKNYPQALREMSAYTGFAKSDIDKFNQTVGRLMPESLRMASKESVGLKDNVGGLVQPTIVAMTAFKAFGIEGTGAIDKTRDAFLNFSQTPIQTAKNLGIMAAAAKGSGVDLQTAQDQINRSSQSLAIFGRQTGESAAVWKTFMETLRAGGVPISEVGNIVESVTKSIAGMTIENRAFIGMVSGLTQGASAIGGALKLEFAMRQEGGMEKNLDALTSTLSKFGGGRIITLEQATNNPQLEQQFVLQRQMLGKLGVQGTAEQQNRMLEVLQKVQSGGMASIDAGKAVKDIFDKGKDLQQASLTALESIDRTLQATFGGRVDTKLDDLNQSLKGKTSGGRSALQTLQDEAIKKVSPDENSLNSRVVRAGFGRLGSDAANAAKRAIRVPSGRAGGRRGPTGVSPMNSNAPMDIWENVKRFTSSGGRGVLGEMRKPEKLPESFLSKAFMPEATKPPSKPILMTDSQIHKDLQQLIDTTKSGFSSLSENKSATGLGKTTAEATVPGTESTLTIKFEGDDKNIIEKVKKAIEEKFNKNTLGIF